MELRIRFEKFHLPLVPLQSLGLQVTQEVPNLIYTLDSALLESLQ